LSTEIHVAHALACFRYQTRRDISQLQALFHRRPRSTDITDCDVPRTTTNQVNQPIKLLKAKGPEDHLQR